MFDIPRKYTGRATPSSKIENNGISSIAGKRIYPAVSCEKEVILLAEILNIVDFIHLIKTKDFSDNKELRDIFD